MLEDSKLFEDFPPVETSKWEELMPAELRERRCFYRKEDAEGCAPVRQEAGWEMAERAPLEGETVVTVGDKLFEEIARLRALRRNNPAIRLYAQPTEQGEGPQSQLHLTVQLLAAVLGGADAVAAHTPLQRKILLILKHEALLDQVADPAAGSYYIEHLTQQH